MELKNRVLLMILDGWGIGDKSKSDAIFQANTPNMDFLKEKYPNSQLLTSGENVGLPEGQMGNSEVGHLNIGAGRIVEVPLFGRSSRTKRLYVNHSVGSLQFLTFSGAIGNGQSVLDQRGLETRMAFSGKITETMYSYF